MINLAYDDTGSGEPVLFIAGTGGAGRTWHIYQVPSFQGNVGDARSVWTA